MRRSILVLGMLCLFVACKKEEVAHLPPERMVPILTDLHLADVYSNMVRDTLHTNGEKNYDSLAIWTNQIFEKYKISQQEFVKSLDWYRDRPVDLDSLFAAVLPELEKAKAVK